MPARLVRIIFKTTDRRDTLHEGLADSPERPNAFGTVPHRGVIVSITTPKPPAEPKLPDGFEPRMLTFDVYGTLVNTPPADLGAFRAILADAGRLDLDPKEFYSFWEQRNIAHYYEPYRT